MGEMELDPRPTTANGEAAQQTTAEPHSDNSTQPAPEITEHTDVEQPLQQTPAESQAQTTAAPATTATGVPTETTVEKVARFLGIPPAIPARQPPSEATIETSTTATNTTEATATAPANGNSATKPASSSSSPRDATHHSHINNGSSQDAQLSSSRQPPQPPRPSRHNETGDYSGKSFSDEHAGATPGVTSAQNPRPEDETTDTASSLFSTGLSIDSDADSALGDIDVPYVPAIRTNQIDLTSH